MRKYAKVSILLLLLILCAFTNGKGVKKGKGKKQPAKVKKPSNTSQNSRTFFDEDGEPQYYAVSKKSGILMKGYVLVGDILMPKSFALASKYHVDYDITLWKNGVIPYVVEPSAFHVMKMVGAVFQGIESVTCINFVPRKIEKHYIKIIAGPTCYSNVGRVKRAPQPVSFSQDCLTAGRVVHQLAHVIGLFHEHNRPDRDENVIIYRENVARGMQHVFFKFEENEELTNSEYDPYSIMQYGEVAYSRDGVLKTMSSRQGVQLVNPSSKAGLTQNDIDKINELYECS